MPRTVLTHSLALLLGTSTAALALGVPARAATDASASYDLPAQPLGAALRAVALASGRNILAHATLIGARQASALKGRFTAEQAVRTILDGSGLHARVDGTSIIVERVQPDPTADSMAEGPADEVLVTGSRIRGAPIASPVTVLSEQAIRDTGLADLGDVARSLPQSFGGGQNPGVGFNVPSSAGGNVGGGSTVNLRGLGSDATLTVVNGRRVPYDSARQGVDISAIPLAAVDRVEVVADGSSAIYGSDAVAGVVNVILKRDYDGLETRARFGDATDGGDFQQQYSVLAGKKWDSGGGFVAYEFNRNTDLTTNQRDYARVRPNVTILPSSQRNAVAASAHQDLTDTLTIEADGLYNDRHGAFSYPLNAAGDLSVSRTRQTFKGSTLALASAARLALGKWNVSLTGTFGTGRTYFQGDVYFSDAFASTSFGRYDNQTITSEVAADGPLFALPGGDAKLALGAGVRDNRFKIFRGAGDPQNAKPSQTSRYAFAELNLPIISPALGVPLVDKLNLSAALRYERYREFGGIGTPKFGLLYAPNAWIDLKASWNRSFRAPSFIELYTIQQALLYPIETFGGTGYPKGTNALFVGGGNAGLKPEKARSWSATAALHPPALSHLSIEVSYFSTHYIDRIVNPLPSAGEALSNPANRAQVTLSPTPAQVTAAIAGAAEFYNVTDGAFDPATVAAIIDSTNVNAGSQVIHGVDAQIQYRTELLGGQAGLLASATYLRSKQQISPTLPVKTLAGQLFNPPHWRTRQTLSWDRDAVRLAATLSTIGGVTDPRAASEGHVHGMATLDLSARYRLPAATGLLKGLELGLSVQNALNAAPAVIATSFFYDTPYDSTNYSPLGRYVAFEVVKKW